MSNNLPDSAARGSVTIWRALLVDREWLWSSRPTPLNPAVLLPSIAVIVLQELKAAVASAEVPVRIKFRPPAGKDDDRHQKTCSDFRFNITIYSSAMPRIDLTTDELIVIDAGACALPAASAAASTAVSLQATEWQTDELLCAPRYPNLAGTTTTMPEIDALKPGDKLVAVAGESVKGLNLSAVKRKIDQLFVQEVLRCQKTHCQVCIVRSILCPCLLRATDTATLPPPFRVINPCKQCLHATHVRAYMHNNNSNHAN
jgi:hypothetical protein